MKEHIYYHWKKILGDALIALLLLLATKIPDLVFDRMFSYPSSDMAVIFAAQYFLICPAGLLCSPLPRRASPKF